VRQGTERAYQSFSQGFATARSPGFAEDEHTVHGRRDCALAADLDEVPLWVAPLQARALPCHRVLLPGAAA